MLVVYIYIILESSVLFGMVIYMKLRNIWHKGNVLILCISLPIYGIKVIECILYMRVYNNPTPPNFQRQFSK